MFCKCAKNFECSSHSRAVLGHGPNWTKLDLWMIRNNNIGQFFFSPSKFRGEHLLWYRFVKNSSRFLRFFIRSTVWKTYLGYEMSRFGCFSITTTYALVVKISPMVIIFQKISSLLSFLSFHFWPYSDILGHISAVRLSRKKSY